MKVELARSVLDVTYIEERGRGLIGIQIQRFNTSKLLYLYALGLMSVYTSIATHLVQQHKNAIHTIEKWLIEKGVKKTSLNIRRCT